VVADVFATHDRRSVLGTYSIERDGDSTLRSYGIYRVLGGELALWKEITG
jgi:branched-chain amino acid transport system substrate-binding protein